MGLKFGISHSDLEVIVKFCHISGYAESPLLSIGYFKWLFRLTLPLLFLHLFKLFCTKNMFPF